MNSVSLHSRLKCLSRKNCSPCSARLNPWSAWSGIRKRWEAECVEIQEELPCDGEIHTFLCRCFQCLHHLPIGHLIGISVVNTQQPIINLKTSIFLGHPIGLQSTHKESTAHHLRIDLAEANTVSSLGSFGEVDLKLFILLQHERARSWSSLRRMKAYHWFWFGNDL